MGDLGQPDLCTLLFEYKVIFSGTKNQHHINTLFFFSFGNHAKSNTVPEGSLRIVEDHYLLQLQICCNGQKSTVVKLIKLLHSSALLFLLFH
jgi:hypothetical protein